MLRLLTKNKFLFFVIILLLAATAFFNSYSSRILQIIIDSTITGNANIKTVFLFAGFGFLGSLLIFIENIIEVKLKKECRLNLRNNIASFMALENRIEHSKNKTKYYELFINNCDYFSSQTIASLMDAIYNASLIIFGLLTLYFIFPYFIIFSIASMLISAFAFKKYDAKLDRLSNDFINHRSNYYNFLGDLLTGHFTIFINKAKNYFEKVSEREFCNYENNRNKYLVKRDLLLNLINLPSISINLLMIVFLFYLILNGKTSIGSLAATLGLSAFIASAFENLFYNIFSIRSGLSILDKKYFGDKINELNKKDNTENTDLQKCITSEINSIEIKDLNFAYGENQVFKNYNLKLKKGINYLQAESGSGKTTLIKLLTKELRFQIKVFL